MTIGRSGKKGFYALAISSAIAFFVCLFPVGSFLTPVTRAKTIKKGGAPCNFSLSPGEATFSAAGGSSFFSVNTSCSWLVTDRSSWIIANASGSGSGTVGYTVQSNSGASRYGVISISNNIGTDTVGFGVVQSGTFPSFTSVNGASFVAPVAPESIVAGFGSGLATTTESATTNPPPTLLGNRRVKVRLASGTVLDAPLYYVSPTQINYLMPSGIPPLFTAIVTVYVGNTSTIVAEGLVSTNFVAPGLFNNGGTASGQWQRYNGSTLVGTGDLSTPIEFGNPDDVVYLVLYGTGFRSRSSLSGVSVTIGGTAATVTYAGPQGIFVGEDQLNVIIPRSLSGTGVVNIVMTVDGRNANTVQVTAGI